MYCSLFFAKAGDLVLSSEDHFVVGPIDSIFETMRELVDIGYNFRSSCPVFRFCLNGFTLFHRFEEALASRRRTDLSINICRVP